MFTSKVHASAAAAVSGAAVSMNRLCSSSHSIISPYLWQQHAVLQAQHTPHTPTTVAAGAVTRDDSSTRSYSSNSSRGGRGGGGRGGSFGRGGGSRDRDSRDSIWDSRESRGGSSRGGGRGGGQRGGGRGSWGSSPRDSSSSSSRQKPQDQDYQQQQQQQPRQPQQQWRQQPQQQQQQQQRFRQPQQQDDDDTDYGWQGGGGGDGEEEDYDSGYLYPSRPSKASIMDTMDGDALYGVAPVLAALTAGIRRPYALIMQEGLTASARKDGKALGEIQRLAAAAGAEMRTMSKHDLNMLSGNRPHQGLILDASPLVWRELDVLPDATSMQQQQESEQPNSTDSSNSSSTGGLRHPVWLALDEVMDPQNLGAMLRCAYCLGVSGVLACSRNCAPLSPVVSKASAGAMELMTLHSCKSMPRTLGAAVNSGWAVIGAAAEEGAVPLSELKVDGPTVLVMGNEGYGVRPLVKRLCTQLVQIEMESGEVSAASRAAASHRLQLVDSLNVSVATGILLHHMLATAKTQ